MIDTVVHVILSVYVVPTDYEEAVAWYRKAAVQGDPVAQRSLGSRFEWGKGVPVDLVQALTWYETAATKDAKAVLNRDRVAQLLWPEGWAQRQN